MRKHHDESKAFWRAVRSAVIHEDPTYAKRFDVALRGCGCTFRFDFSMGRHVALFAGKPPETQRQSDCFVANLNALDWANAVMGGTQELNLLLYCDTDVYGEGLLELSIDTQTSVSVFTEVDSAASFLLSLPTPPED